MKGLKCKCGFATTANRIRCPRCGKHMKVTEWPNVATVLAFVKLGVTPDGHELPMDLLMLQVEDGPRLVCWTDIKMSEGEEVDFTQVDRTYICSPRQHRVEDERDKIPKSEGDRRHPNK